MNRGGAVVVEFLLRIEVDRGCFLTECCLSRQYLFKKAPLVFITDAEKGISNRKTKFPRKKNIDSKVSSLI